MADEHPPSSGHPIVPGASTCRWCGHLDGPEENTGLYGCTCWTPATEAYLDALYLDAILGGPDAGR